MKIGISGYYLLETGSGYSRSISNLLPALSKIDKENHYCIFVPEMIEAKLPANFEIEVIPMNKIFGESMGRFLWDNFQLPRAAFKHGVDILHYPYPTLPYFKQKFPLIVSINNIINWKFKEYHQSSLVKIKQYFKVQSFKNARRIIVPSVATKMDIINNFHIDNQIIKVIPYGKSEIFKRGTNKEEAELIKRRYNLKFPFIFYVGSFDFRKNIKRLIRAFSLLSSKRPELNLVIGGGISTVISPFVFSLEEMMNYATQYNVFEKVKFIRLVPERDLLILYNLASGFIYPSLYEGFATAVIEAMACGCPVAVSNTSCLPEIVNNAGLLFDPYNEKEIASSIERIVYDYNLRRALINKGLIQANNFSWERTARETLNLYQESVQ